MRKILLIGLCILLLCSFASGTLNYESLDASPFALDGSLSGVQGANISIKSDNVCIHNASKDSAGDSNATRCRLWGSNDANSPPIESVDFVSSTCVFSCSGSNSFNTGGLAYVVVDEYGKQYNRYDRASGDTKITGTYADYMPRCVYNASGVWKTEACGAFFINVIRVGIIEDNLTPTYTFLNLSTTLPTNGSRFKVNTIDFNLTANSTYDFNCSLYFNETFYKKIEYSAGVEVAVNFTKSFVDSNNSYFFSCQDNGTQLNTTKSLFFIDTIFPVVTTSSNIDTNLSIFYGNSTQVWWFNFTDENLYGVNITIDGSIIMYNVTGITQNPFNVSFNFSASDYDIKEGYHTVLVEASDSHTDVDIGIYDYDKNFLTKALTYNFDGDYIRVTPVTRGLFSGFDTWKERDRYSFEYERDFMAKILYGNDMSFSVTSNTKLDIIENSNYTGHIVSYGLKKWIDFQNEVQGGAIVEQISDNEILVTFKDVKEDLIVFRSLGGLNVVNKTYKFYYGNFTETYENQSLESDTLTFTLNISKNTSFVGSTTASLYFNGTQYTASKTSSANYDYYTRDINTDLISSSVINRSVMWFNWNYTVANLGAGNNIVNTTNNSNTTVFKMLVSNCTNSSAVFDTLNTSVYKDGTNTLVNVDTDALLTVWNRSSLVSRDYPFKYKTGSYPKACMFPQWGQLNTNYQWEFTATGYDLNTYSVNNDRLNGTTPKTVNIYMVNSTTSTAITVTVVDEIDNPLVGYQVDVNFYDLGTNSYILISSKITNGEGKVIFDLDVTNKEYQFVVKNTTGHIIYTEPKSILTDTTYTLRVTLGTTPTSVINNLQALDYTLTIDSNSNNFSVSWIDNTGLIDRAKLVVTRGNVSSGVVLSTQTSTSDAGVMYYNTSDKSGVYLGYFYVVATEDGLEYLLDTVSNDIREEYDIFGKEALFMTLLFVGTMAFVAIKLSAEISILVTLFGMWIFYLMGFMEVALTGLVSLAIAGIIIVVRLKKRLR